MKKGAAYPQLVQRRRTPMTHEKAYKWASYDDIAETYDAIAVPHYFDAAARQLISFTQLRPHQRLLDVGSGTGAVAMAALSSVKPTFMISTDVSLGMLLQAKKRGIGSSVVSTVLNLPFPAKSFDCVTASFLLNHVTDCRAAIGEMMRLVRCGGKLAVTSWATGPSENEIGKAWSEIASKYVDAELLRTALESTLPWESRLSHRETLETIALDAGLAIVISRKVEFPITMNVQDYLQSRCVAMTSRFMKALLDAEVWYRFTQEVRTSLDQAFGDVVQFVAAVNFVVGEKP